MARVCLMRGEELLGTITGLTPDQPFFGGTFTPTPPFEDVRALFQEELHLLNRSGDDFDVAAWENAYQRILDLGLRLVFDDGSEVTDFLLHVDGSHAWFRY